jgi:hypothetical protein
MSGDPVRNRGTATAFDRFTPYPKNQGDDRAAIVGDVMVGMASVLTPGAVSRWEKEHRAGGAFIRRPHWPVVLGLAAFHVRSLGATSIYSRSVLGESRKLRPRVPEGKTLRAEKIATSALFAFGGPTAVPEVVPALLELDGGPSASSAPVGAFGVNRRDQRRNRREEDRDC